MAPDLPYGLLVFSACLITLSAIMVSAEKDVLEMESGGLFDNFGIITDLVVDVLTFNIDGAPWWIRFPLSIMTIVPWIYILVVLIMENAIPFT